MALVHRVSEVAYAAAVAKQSCTMSVTKHVCISRLNVLGPRANWVCINDPVMGGKSSSQNFYNHGTGTQVFSGNVSTRNNGGFCSSWLSIHPSIDLSRYDGIYIDAVALEATTFGMMLRDNSCGANGVYFYHTFSAAPVGSPSFKRTYIPFSTMKPMWRGQFVDHKPLAKSAIIQLGLMSTKDFIVGDFELYIREIGKYKD